MLRLFDSLKKYRDGHQPLYHISLVVFFWAVADGINSFALPIFMEQVFGDLALVGLVFASSSFFGLLADILMGSEQKGRTFKPYFILSALLAAFSYWLTFKAQSILSFFFIMALWGFYYDALNFGLVDFLSRFSQKDEHSQSSGVVQMLYSLGYLLAPLMAGYMVFRGRTVMAAALFFILLSLLAFFIWFKKEKSQPDLPRRKLNLKEELNIWRQVARRSSWVLIGLFLLNIWDSLIWSLGPIFLVENFAERSAYIMACFGVPRVFIQGYAGRWADKGSKKFFLTIGLVTAGVFLALFGLESNLGVKLFLALGSALGASLVWPAADGLFIDMIDGYKDEEEEVAGVRGFAHNLAYIIGPLLAGILAKNLGLPAVFLIYGLSLVFGGSLMALFWPASQ